jgi:hypothetical protein
MRLRLLVIPFVAAAVGCGGTPTSAPLPTPDEEKAAEQQLKQEALREGGKGKKAKHNPDDD